MTKKRFTVMCQVRIDYREIIFFSKLARSYVPYLGSHLLCCEQWFSVFFSCDCISFSDPLYGFSQRQFEQK